MLENDVRGYRTRLGWSQDELARRSGLSRAGISAIETGRLVPSTAAALALAAALGCTVEALFRLAGAGRRQIDRRAGRGRLPTGSCRYWRAEIGGRVLALSGRGLSAGAAYRTTGRSATGPFTTTPALIRRARSFWRAATPPRGFWRPSWRASADLRLIVLPRSSRAALELLARGLVHAAGVHLARSDQEEGNAAAVLAASRRCRRARTFSCSAWRTGRRGSPWHRLWG